MFVYGEYELWSSQETKGQWRAQGKGETLYTLRGGLWPMGEAVHWQYPMKGIWSDSIGLGYAEFVLNTKVQE